MTGSASITLTSAGWSGAPRRESSATLVLLILLAVLLGGVEIWHYLESWLFLPLL